MVSCSRASRWAGPCWSPDQELWADKERRAAYNETIRLEDWLLPVAYQNREPRLAFREFTPEEATRWYAEAADRFPEPETSTASSAATWTCCGSRRRCSRRATSALQGMGGSGKTTLLRHLAHWQELTGLVEKAFYFGWDKRAWTRGQKSCAPRPPRTAGGRGADVRCDAQMAQEKAVADALRARRYLLILDNLESITGASLADPHSLDETQRKELTASSKRWRVGLRWFCSARVARRAAGAGHVRGQRAPARGPRPRGRLQSRRRGLGARGRARAAEGAAFPGSDAAAVGLPAGAPGGAAELGGRTSAEVLEALQQGEAGLDAAGRTDVVEAKTRSLLACIEYSHGNLDPEEQALLYVSPRSRE